MSLLLDALKRAEEAKRAKLSAESAPAPEQKVAEQYTPSATPQASTGPDRSRSSRGTMQELSIEDYKEVIPPKVKPNVPGTDVRPAGVQGLPSELALENMSDADLVESPTPKVPLPEARSAAPVKPSRLDAASVEATQSRDTARSVFVAKQPIGSEDDSRKKWLVPVVSVILLLAAGGGWYVWNEVSRMSRPAAPNIASRPASSGTLPPAQLATGQPGAKSPDVSAPKPSAASLEPPLPPLLPPPSTDAPLPPALVLRAPVSGPALSQREELAKSLKAAPSAKEAPVALQLARSIEPAAINADLAAAYAALKSADYNRARTLYAKLLQADPLSLDAHLGMATIFARRGDSASAMNHYRQVLALDPRNGTALAGLLAVSDSRSPSLEIELRTLVGRNPETSSLQFSLGNLYASERRWVEAQQAYFEAFRLESGNADYVYNLAVSLDQLKKANMALDYYRRALRLSPTSGGQFDTSAVARRIKELTDLAASN